MTADKATLDFYRTRAPRFTMAFGQAPSRHLDAFLDRVVDGARILELGCGGGRDSSRIIERGFNLDATDGVAAMVRKANERYGVNARQMLFEELDAADEYDAIWAHACLLHIARKDLPGILRRIFRALRPGGWHYANYKMGLDEDRCLLGRLHNFPDRPYIESMYRMAGFDIVDGIEYGDAGADGTVRDWIALTVHKE